MTSFRLSDAASIAARLNDLPKHRVALAVYVAASGGHAYAVVRSSDGEVLAWDGWYTREQADPTLSRSLVDLPWDESDEYPAFVLAEANAAWLGGPLARWLAPTFSVAREAADLVADHYSSRDYDETPAQFSESSLAAYLPIVDDDVFVAEIERIVGRSSWAKDEEVVAFARGALYQD